MGADRPAPHVMGGDNWGFRAVSMVKWPGDPADWVMRGKHPWQTWVEDTVMWRGDSLVEDTAVPGIGG